MSYRPIGGRRQRSAAWQWALIGFIPGLFCGLGIMIAVMLEGSLPAYFQPTAEPKVVTTVVHVVMTATDDVNQPTPTPLAQFIVVTATPDPASAGGERPAPAQQTNAGSAGEVVSVPVQATPIPTDVPAIVTPPTQAPSSDIPELLRVVRSLTVTIPGVSFVMGTTPGEVTEAVRQCITRDAGACEASYAQDSFPAHQVTVDAFLMESTEVTFEQFVAF